MRDLLRADLYRMFHKRWFWLCVCFMEALSGAFILIQRTAMDYSVSLDRVLFLPMSFYGLAAAALIGLFVGDDYRDGMIRNKIVARQSRSAIYFSAQVACWLGCLAVYSLMLLTTLGVGAGLFAVNVTGREIIGYYALGLCTCLAYGSVFCMLSMLCANQSAAVALCMASAFAMLFLCLHTNQTLAQKELVDGAANPHYAAGLKRIVYFYLHDINPGGQAAQLSAMACYSALRFVAADLCWAGLSLWAGSRAFGRMDIK